MLRKICIAAMMCFGLLLTGAVSPARPPLLSASTASAEDVWAASIGSTQYYIMTETINGPYADCLYVKVKNVRDGRLVRMQGWNYRGDEGEIRCSADNTPIGPARNSPLAVAILRTTCDYVGSDFARNWGY